MKHTAIVITLLVLLLGGCSTLSVQTDYDPGYDFARLETWRWVEGARPSGDIRIDNDLVRRRIERAVEAELAARGYRRIDRGDPDFWVSWFGAIDRRIRYETIGTYYGSIGYGPYHGVFWPGHAYTYPVEYQEGTLIIDILDGPTRRLVWRATATDRVNESARPEERDQDIREAVARILAGFPPGRGAAGEAQSREK